MTFLNLLAIATILFITVFVAIFTAGHLVIKYAQSKVLDSFENLSLNTLNKFSKEPINNNDFNNLKEILADFYKIPKEHIKDIDICKIEIPKKQFITDDKMFYAELNKLKNDKKYIEKELAKAVSAEDYEYANYLKDILAKLNNPAQK